MKLRSDGRDIELSYGGVTNLIKPNNEFDQIILKYVDSIIEDINDKTNSNYIELSTLVDNISDQGQEFITFEVIMSCILFVIYYSNSGINISKLVKEKSTIGILILLIIITIYTVLKVIGESSDLFNYHEFIKIFNDKTKESDFTNSEWYVFITATFKTFPIFLKEFYFEMIAIILLLINTGEILLSRSQNASKETEELAAILSLLYLEMLEED